MDNSTSESEPGTGTYIIAWVLGSLAARAISYVLTSIAYSSVRTMDDLMIRSMFVLPVSIVVTASAIIGVYSLFPGIRVAKVIPYFWGLGALGMIAGMVKLGGLGVDFPAVYYLLIAAEFVLTILALTWGFRRIGRL